MTVNSAAIRLDGVTFVLKEPHAFEWLHRLGTVFAVFDQQDSGNLSFGVEREGVKRFVKYAGARTMHYEGGVQDAVSRLKEAALVFEMLAHPSLVQLLEHYPAGAGYAVVFKWEDGVSLSRQAVIQSEDGRGIPTIDQFRQLSGEERFQAMDAVLAFHAHVEAMGFVAIDFYDGSLLYDFHTRTIKICDIDLYSPAPVVNTMGRMWGSSRFMAPEEFELGAPIDSRTNVYNLGAMVFCLLGCGAMERTKEVWQAGDARYAVAARAVEPSREARFGSVREFYEEWRKADDGRQLP